MVKVPDTVDPARAEGEVTDQLKVYAAALARDRPRSPACAPRHARRPLRGRGRPGVSRCVKRQRPEPLDEDWIVLVILLGPFAYVARWICRRKRFQRTRSCSS